MLNFFSPSFTESSDVFLQKGEMKRATRSTPVAPVAENANAEKAAVDKAAADAKVRMLDNRCVCGKSTVCFRKMESIDMETMLNYFPVFL